MERKTALISGASQGVGLELSYLFARDGFDLVLVARNKEQLDRISQDLQAQFGTKSTVIQADLCLPEASQEIFSKVGEHKISINALVNNAGFGAFGPFNDIDLQRELDMIQVNITAVTALTKLFLGPMLERKSGGILNVASTAAFQPGPLMAVYYATKAYVLHFTEALAEELQGTGVTVTALCPGATETGFKAQAGLEQSKLFTSKLNSVSNVKVVAASGFAGFKTKRRIVIPGLQQKMLVNTVRFMPRRMVTKVVKRMQERLS